jgi:hypothetical protein
VKVKVDSTLEQATSARMGSRDIALLFLKPRDLMGWVVNAKVRPLYLHETDPVPIVHDRCVDLRGPV